MKRKTACLALAGKCGVLAASRVPAPGRLSEAAAVRVKKPSRVSRSVRARPAKPPPTSQRNCLRLRPQGVGLGMNRWDMVLPLDGSDSRAALAGRDRLVAFNLFSSVALLRKQSDQPSPPRTPVLPGGCILPSLLLLEKARARLKPAPMRQNRHAWWPFVVLRVSSWQVSFSLVSNKVLPDQSG